MIVIDSGCHFDKQKNHTEKVKVIVNELLEKNLLRVKSILLITTWGKFENLLNDKYCKVKRIVLEPKKFIPAVS